ncbi:hypothetical protein MMC13_004475 [Lambiella insularis]|nr:hypothetical protein [Lambiella insularis]
MASKSLQKDVLLLVDVQQGFDHPSHWGSQRSNPSFESNIKSLLGTFRKAARSQLGDSRPEIIHIYHSSLLPESPLHESSDGIKFQRYAEPEQGEAVISKSVNSAFIGTDLEELLRSIGVQRLFVAGLTTDHCVSTTVRMAANLGVTDYWDEVSDKKVKGQVIFIGDATATWGKGAFDATTVHEVHVTSLKGEFCEVMVTSQVIDMINKQYRLPDANNE